MSLPAILKYIYNHGSEEVIRRGKKIFYTSGVQMLDVDHLVQQIRFRVRNDLYQNFYTVTVNKYLQPKEMAVRCQCPYNMGEICRHEVAALFQLNDVLQSGFFENVNVLYDQKHTVIRMRQVSRQILQIFCSPEIMDTAERIVQENLCRPIKGRNDVLEADVPDEDLANTYRVTLKQNTDRYFDTSCGCNEQNFPLCVHKTALFLQTLKKHGSSYFQGMQNWDVQKNKLLEQYGYSLSDDLTNKFSFIYENGKPFLRVLDTTIQKVAPVVATVSKPERSLPAAVTAAVMQREDVRLGIVVDTDLQAFPYVNLILIAVKEPESGSNALASIEKLELSQYINPLRFREDERELLTILRKFTRDELMKFLIKNLPFGELLPDNDTTLSDNPDKEVKDQSWEYLLPKYRKLFHRYASHPYVYMKKAGKPISSGSLIQIHFSDSFAYPQLIVTKESDGYLVTQEWILDNNAMSYHDITIVNPALVLYDGHLYTQETIPGLKLAEAFQPDGFTKVLDQDWNEYLEKNLIPQAKDIHIHFAEEIIERFSDIKPTYRLYLHEREGILVIELAFLYDTEEVRPTHSGDIIQPRNGIVRIIKRNEEVEQEFTQFVHSLHTDMQYNKKEFYFHLPGTALLTNNWFHRFTEVMRERNVELMGYENLKSLRVSFYKPETIMQVSSGIDWFDATIDLKFGDEKVSLSEVKKALAHKQNFVKLGDGSLGLLPDEWVKKYSLLLKMGETKGSNIRLKKFHFSLLDDLLDKVTEKTLHDELQAKKENLQNILNSDPVATAPPDSLLRVLRPYQVSGFQWLLLLNEAGWGGILADDMGLGKTVQALTFFQHYKNKLGKVIFLVVCPTSLMYNWQNEITKFTPELTSVIHHGPKRTVSMASYDAYDIIITTYGTMRSDIAMLRAVEFDYVVLDESQFIKNPQSQVAKASLLLKAKNRLALSGTPVQNNTFDLYAQLNFLNPGMLGSREFFMSEFASPVDKLMDEEVKQQLRKLTYPFLLRRTKEQVAKDLPEKTETILYCEMGDEQRKIYDTYKNIYRSQILGMIEERGMERSQMHILQGLTKLRQICDSPAILNETERFHNHSVKLDELTRELTENVGDHKALVFSQFLGMLSLIKKSLDKHKISYVYFDGSSTSMERETAITEFQNNPECRVFLISMKAGGVGLNLTAADYVYIVDPWWNPAVEQQAIDRTHRIGQTKNIFAYRLICKDSLEEKMLQLQERKRILASELVSDDNTLMKRLTKDDIAFLFS